MTSKQEGKQTNTPLQSQTEIQPVVNGATTPIQSTNVDRFHQNSVPFP